MEGGRGDWSNARASSPMFALSVCRAAMKYAQKRTRSLSPLSKETQVTQRSLCGIHSPSSVVLPKPAGAVISVSVRSIPCFSRSVKRVRSTLAGRRRGMKSFVLRRLAIRMLPPLATVITASATCIYSDDNNGVMRLICHETCNRRVRAARVVELPTTWRRASKNSWRSQRG